MFNQVSTKSVILYADDDVDDLELIKDVFFQHTYAVELVTVSDGMQALSFLKNLPLDKPSPCLVILDINMPKMGGKEALASIRSIDRFKSIPTILFTTSNQPLDQEFAQRFNAGFITKPIEYSQIDLIARKFIEHCSDEVKKQIAGKRGLA